MAHLHANDLDVKLRRLLAIRQSVFPPRNNDDAMELLVSTQDALHVLALARDLEAPSSPRPRLPVLQ